SREGIGIVGAVERVLGDAAPFAFDAEKLPFVFAAVIFAETVKIGRRVEQPDKVDQRALGAQARLFLGIGVALGKPLGLEPRQGLSCPIGWCRGWSRGQCPPAASGRTRRSYCSRSSPPPLAW